jgi:hypothetical protein
MKSLKSYLLKIAPKSWIIEYRDYRNNQFERKKYNLWRANNYPLPSPEYYKSARIKDFQKKSKITTLIETGTFLGDMIYFNRKNFKQIISVELSDELFLKANDRFKDIKNISLIKGDSALVLAEIVSKLNNPAIFWLDGHYSKEFKGFQTAKGNKECPILEELEPILKSPLNHIILIDDARMFDGKNDYPTEEELYNFICQYRSEFMFDKRNDIFEIIL